MSRPVDYQFDAVSRSATLTFNRPGVLNAIDVETARSFCEAVLQATAQAGIRLIVIRGAGRAFVAGGDLQRFADDFDYADRVVNHLLDPLHSAILALHTTPALVLACVHGVVAGAGLSLMLGCDLVLAAEDTRLLLAYNKVAAAPDCGGTFFLPRRIGTGAAMQLMVGSGELTAQEARAMNLLNWCVPAHELQERLESLSAEILSGPSHAYGRYKELIRSAPAELQAHLERERIAFCAATKTKDFREGVTAFLTRRAPVFLGC
ncbi:MULTISPECIES: enoyl-CoA hydratase/isomerase family protein [Pseudomonas]|uniref:Enoyl-CoA hydratase/isomerase family protein n=1 Tax=Pseudomonas sessilinigenes TaxID=658629 RepID=A0ABX8MKV7_9PSED|nr:MULTISPECIES: enoyl-CoA hydratase-related protein [Pseudomonas]AZC18538.1 Enoyl-CoA hydratase [Pseudomonas sp. CMR5c]AZC26648.1 Enoyl-CoA hydratase [Pseudomonas sessilinigenes]QXH39362.1 enoyl-CoA hydratase/isomerase family protein [Pseudomonas sessilinigenes]